MEGQSGSSHASGSHTAEHMLPPQGPGVSGGERRGRGHKSDMWAYYTEVNIETEDGKTERYAECNSCAKRFKHPPGSGTGTLSKHYKKYHSAGSSSSLPQSQLGVHGGGLFSYSRDRNVSGMTDYIIEAEQPLSFGEHAAFTSYVTNVLQPAYTPVPRNTIKANVLKKYSEGKEFLTAILESLPNGVSLTTDCWYSRARDPYICVTAHWIDSDWNMQKRILAFRVIQFPHTGPNIRDSLRTICDEYRITNKIFSISLDNATANTNALDLFMPISSPILDGSLFHVRCACHILNLCVQDVMGGVSGYIEKVRNAILFTKSSGRNTQEFRRMARDRGLRRRSLPTDTANRWNSTYNMLISAFEYREIISDIYNSRIGYANLNPLTENDWLVANNIAEFLAPFKRATDLFSGVYFPTSALVLPELFNIAAILAEYEQNGYFLELIARMRRKIDKYYKELPMLLILAAIMDPRLKKSGVDTIVRNYHAVMGHDHPEEYFVDLFDTVSLRLREMYDIYSASLAPVSVSSLQTTTAPISGITNRALALVRSKKKQKGPSSSSTILNELTIYLDAEFRDPRHPHAPVESDLDDIDLLEWWKTQSAHLPVLASMARDLLQSPASSVASECAFSMGERILSEKRSSLSPKTLEWLVCTKDWLAAARRQQQLIDLERDKAEASDEEEESTTSSSAGQSQYGGSQYGDE